MATFVSDRDDGPRTITISDDNAPTAATAPEADTDLRAELLRERAARAEAERIARANAAQAVQNSFAAVAGRQESLKAELEKAVSLGESADVARLTEELSRNTAVLTQHEQWTHQNQHQRQNFDSWLTTQAPENQVWIKRFRDRFQNDPEFSRRAVDASGAALRQGVPLGSPEYYAIVDRAVGVDSGLAGSPTSSASRSSGRSSLYSAPPTQDPFSFSGRRYSEENFGSVHLTPSEVEAAVGFLNHDNLPRDQALAAYARQKAHLKREGRM